MKTTISPTRLKELEHAEAKLKALEEGGVDNWEYYDQALIPFNEQLEKEKKISKLMEKINFAIRDDCLQIIEDLIREFINKNYES